MHMLDEGISDCMHEKLRRLRNIRNQAMPGTVRGWTMGMTITLEGDDRGVSVAIQGRNYKTGKVTEENWHFASGDQFLKDFEIAALLKHFDRHRKK